MDTNTIMEAPNTPKVKRFLYKGTQGARVKYIQECLNIINTFQPFRPFEDELKNNGEFDQKTHFFVVSFQIYTGVTPNGFVDYLTMTEIEKRIARVSKAFKRDPFDIY